MALKPINPVAVEAWAGFVASILTPVGVADHGDLLEHPDLPPYPKAPKLDQQWAYHRYLDLADAYFATH